MNSLRPSLERGHTQMDWLDSRHTFSFDQYFDPQYMSFGPLRVINEDIVAPGGGFGTHPHKDMEIITYVISGGLQHKDSIGTGSVISAGEIQKMSAGTGIFHSEFNASQTEPVHLLQIWIMPSERGLKPGYEQERYTLESGKWQLLGANDGSGLISIHQKVRLWALKADKDSKVTFEPAKGSKVWIQTVKGSATIGGATVAAGDGLAVDKDERFEVIPSVDTELLAFEIHE
jgi:redox-sensitive bicupin YhaK (pirin superfamily)